MIKIIVNNTITSSGKKDSSPEAVQSTNNSDVLPDIKSGLVTGLDRLGLETLQTLDLNNNRFAIDPLVVTVLQKMGGRTTNVEGKVKLYHNTGWSTRCRGQASSLLCHKEPAQGLRKGLAPIIGPFRAWKPPILMP